MSENRPMRPRRTTRRASLAAAFLLLAAGLASPAAGGAADVDPEADRVLKAMSAFLNGVSTFSYSAEIDNELINLEGQKLQLSGSATALFECSASSLRYQMELTKATRSERSQVKKAQETGEDPDCPRHGEGFRLFRKGKELVCPLCEMSFGKV